MSSAQLGVLDRLRKARPKARKKAMMQTPGVKRLLRLVAYNVLKGNVPMTRSQYQKLARFKRSVRLLSCADISDRKRLALVQKGGLLPALIGPLLGSAVAGLAGRLFG